jgi:hypothetical protein
MDGVAREVAHGKGSLRAAIRIDEHSASFSKVVELEHRGPAEHRRHVNVIFL